MKGQITIEYLASVFAFIGIITFVFLSFSKNVPLYIEEIGKENAQSNAYQISELLLNDYGHPEDWGIGSVDRIGLSDENADKINLISWNKVVKLRNLCNSDYNQVKNKLGFDKDLIIKVFKIASNGDRSLELECKPAYYHKDATLASVSRIASYDGGIIELVVQVGG